MHDMFIGKESICNLRNKSRLLQAKFNPKSFGCMYFQYFGSKIWDSLPTCVEDQYDLGIAKMDQLLHDNRLLKQL